MTEKNSYLQPTHIHTVLHSYLTINIQKSQVHTVKQYTTH